MTRATRSAAPQQSGLKQPAEKSALTSLSRPIQFMRKLQRTVGNQATRSLLGMGVLQPKLSIGPANDVYEQEADRVADQVTRMPNPQSSSGIITAPARILRSCRNCQEDIQRTPLPTISTITSMPSVQRVCPECEDELQRQVSEDDEQLLQRQPKEEDELVQRKDRSGATTRVTPAIESGIQSLKGGGRPLSTSSRDYFEARLGADFSNVRIHSDGPAAKTASLINARAYTIGQHVVFGRGEFQPDTPSGRHLLAHELTHTIQQRAAPRVGQNPQGLRYSHGPVPGVQRVADKSNTPTGMGCSVDSSAGRPAGTNIMFGSSNRRLDATDDTIIAGVYASWVAGGSSGTIDVHGFASSDGRARDNWILSCDRAEIVRTRLVTLGVPAANVTAIAHGETEEFSAASNAPNRVAVIQTIAAPVPPATAVFSESAAQRFAGYDNSVTPNWQVVPVGETRIANVTISPAGAVTPTYVSANAAIATVAPTATGIQVTGVADGSTTIQARHGATVLDTLRVEVKAQRAITVDYHFMSDTARRGLWIFRAAQPQHSTARAVGSVPGMTAVLNSVWQRQANVQFTTGAIDSRTVASNLGAQVVGANTAATEWKKVVAFRTGGDWNVFFVWEFELVASAGVDAVGGGTAVGDTILEDAPCPTAGAGALALSHEGGHFLSRGTLPHTAATIMAGCGSITSRVSKAEADAVNP